MVFLELTPLMVNGLENSYFVSIPRIQLIVPNLCNHSNSLLCCFVYIYVLIYMCVFMFMWVHMWVEARGQP